MVDARRPLAIAIDHSSFTTCRLAEGVAVRCSW